MPMIDSEDLVSNAEIARMAGVTPAAVSNWTARHADFPKPVFKNAKFKLYLWSEVYEWLTTPRTIAVQLPAKVVRRSLPAKFPKEERQ